MREAWAWMYMATCCPGAMKMPTGKVMAPAPAWLMVRKPDWGGGVDQAAVLLAVGRMNRRLEEHDSMDHLARAGRGGARAGEGQTTCRREGPVVVGVAGARTRS